jgi:RNA polymerase sigma-70 factor (ECF subfamily)
MKPLSAQQILGGLNRHEQRAMDWLYRNHYDDVQRWVEGATGGCNETADLVNDVFTGLFEYKGQFSKVRQIRYFLFQKAKNISLDYMKHKQLVEARSEDLARHLQSLSSEEEWEARWLQAGCIRMATGLLERFSEKSREIYLLHLREHLTNSQIAERLRITESAVANHKHKVMKFIRSNAREISKYLLFIINALLCIYQ